MGESVRPGISLGSYRILAALGAGGMGEVYRATDTKLGRDVAIKVLPESLASDPERLARFEREARLLASLNHPNIAAIYGLEEAGAANALVMELVEGPTLGERLELGPVPLEEALDIARQVAEALEEAHEKGVIHRDLKPGNIMVTPEGQVKVLDFGLAKALEAEGAVADPEHSPTLTVAGTRAGVIMGTAGYMSPEQAKGKRADRRADIWAFGVILYEMLAGRRAFHGETVSDALALALTAEPAWDELPLSVPSGLQRLMRRCLVKEVKNRLQAIGDARIELQECVLTPAGDSNQAGQPRGSWTRGWAYLLGTLGLAVATFVVGRYSWPPASDPSPKRLSLTLPDSITLKTANGLAALALSPDGKKVVFVGEDRTGTQLYLRALDDSITVPLAGTRDAEQVTFSPDGCWVAFTASSQLKKLSLDGGSPVTVTDHPVGDFGNLRGLSWGLDDRIVLGESSGSLKWVPASGGTPEVLLRLDSGMAILPQWLPDGGGILFTIGHGTSVRASIGLYSFQTNSYEVIVDKGYGARYLPTGHLLYSSGTDLFVAPFDPAEDEKAGAPLQLGERALVDPWGDVVFAVSPNGLFVYAPSQQDAANRLIWIDRTGNVTPVTEMRRGFQFPRLSPSGNKVALTVVEGSRHAAHVFDLQRETLTALVADRETDLPIWTPDGTGVAFNLTDGGPWHLYLQQAGGAGDLKQITTAEIFHLPNSWSPDGKTLTFMTKLSGGLMNPGDIWMVDVTSQQGPQTLIGDLGMEMEARISPDGSHIVYDSDISGRREVWVRPFPGPGSAQQVSNNGGHDAIWSPDGGELFYRNGRKMMVVSVETGTQLRVGKPELLFEGPDLGGVKYYRSYDITPDGRRFIAVEQAPGPRQLSVILNWFEELKRLAPGKS